MKWNADASHSNVGFKVRHMGMSSVRGQFRSFDFGGETDDAGRLTSLHATIDPASVDTGDEKRDAHLRSDDFFAVDAHPEIRFQSTAVESLGNGRYRVTGDLAMHGETHPATFEIEAADPIRDPWGMTRVGAGARGTIRRKTWGLNWNQLLEAGSLLVGEEVAFEIDAQAVAAPQEAEEPVAAG